MWRARCDWFEAYADEVERFVESLPPRVVKRWRRRPNEIDLVIEAATARHRRIDFWLAPDGVEFSVGKLWGDYQVRPTQQMAWEFLAALEALADGRVKEVVDRRTGLVYQIYRLRTRGLTKFVRDSEYSLLHRLNLPVRRVKIMTLGRLRVGATA